MFKHVYVDLCDTLIKGNTTFMFLDSFFKYRKNDKYWLYRKFSTSFFMRVIFKLLLLVKIDLNRRIAIRFLKGYDAEFLRSHVKEMLENGSFVENKQLIEVLQCAKSKNIPITIVSASLDFIVEVVACHYSFNYYSSKLGYINNKCQGCITLDLLFNKDKIFDSIDLNNVTYCFISDNVQDVKILKSCVYGFGVPNIKNEKAFNNHNVTLINYNELINLIKSG